MMATEMEKIRAALAKDDREMVRIFKRMGGPVDKRGRPIPGRYVINKPKQAT